MIPLVVSLLEIIRNNMFAAVTFASDLAVLSYSQFLQLTAACLSPISMHLHCVTSNVQNCHAGLAGDDMTGCVWASC